MDLKIRFTIKDHYDSSETRLENIFKHRCPFKFVEEEFSEERKTLICSKKFESVNRIKSRQSSEELVDNIIPFMTYLKSLIKIENNPKYLKSTYHIFLSYYKEGVTEEQEKYIAVFTTKLVNLFNETYHAEYYYEDDHYNYDIHGLIPEEYFKIILKVSHYYEHEIILKELDHCPPNAFKKDQCVICLNNQPNILYKPCLHFCTCEHCDKEEE